jgi:hypothetical protein
MTFGDAWQDWGLATSKDESRKTFGIFAEAGGNFIDTVNKRAGVRVSSANSLKRIATACELRVERTADVADLNSWPEEIHILLV